MIAEENLTGKKRREPRINLPKSAERDWRKKIHPFFLRVAEENKKIVQLNASSSPQDREEAQRLIQNPPVELVEEARRLGDGFAKSGRVGYLPAMTMLGLESVPPDPEISDTHYMLSWLSWFRYGKSLPQLAEQRETDWKAAKQFVKVLRDYEAWRFGRLDPDKRRFKMDQRHQELVANGLNFGIEDLTTEELADFFYALCPCGERHSAENLRKLRTRVMRVIRTFKTSPS